MHQDSSRNLSIRTSLVEKLEQRIVLSTNLPQGTNLIQNSEFEDFSGTGNQGYYSHEDVASWSESAGQQIKLYNFVGAPGRGKVLQMDGSAGSGNVSQEILTNAGQLYVLSLDVREGPASGPVNQIQVAFGGQILDVISPNDRWQTRSFVVQAGSGDTTTLSISQLDEFSDEAGAFVDNVLLVPVEEIPVANSSFEETNLPDETFFRNRDVAGWNSVGDGQSKTIHLLNSGGSDGDRFLNLDGSPNALDRVFQTISTEAGMQYFISFDLRTDSGQVNAENELRVRWNREHGGTFFGSSEWQNVGFFGNADSDLTRLVFREAGLEETGAAEGLGPFIDNVKLLKVVPGNESLQVEVATDTTIQLKENDGPVKVFNSVIDLNNSVNEFLTGAVVRIQNLLDGPQELLKVESAVAEIRSSYNSESGELRLEGFASVDAYTAALESVSYENNAIHPDLTPRIIQLSIEYGKSISPAATRNLELVSEPVILESEIAAESPALFFENGDAAKVFFSVIDFDSSTGSSLSGAKVQIKNLKDGPDEILTVDAGTTGITVQYDASTGLLTLTGNKSVDDYLAVLDSLTYRNNAINPDQTLREIEFTVESGSTVSAGASRQLQILPKPVKLTVEVAVDTPARFIENFGPVNTLFAIVDLSNHATEKLTGAKVRIQEVVDVGSERLAVDVEGTGIKTFFDWKSGTLELTGLDSVGAYLQVLESLTYDNVSEDPSGASRTLLISTSYGNTSSNVATREVELIPESTTLGVEIAAGDPGEFVQNLGPVNLLRSVIDLSTSDGMNIHGATVQIENLLDIGHEHFIVETGSSGISSVYDSATGRLRLQGANSIEGYLEVLETLRYNNTSSNPDTTTRVIKISIDDMDSVSKPAIRHLEIHAQASHLKVEVATDLPAEFVEKKGPIDVFESVVDIDNTAGGKISGAFVQIGNLLNGSDEFLTVNTEGTEITAQFDASTGRLRLTGEALPEDYIQVLGTLTYDNLSADPDVTPRKIQVAVIEGNSVSNLADSTVNVTAVNDPPIIAPLANQSTQVAASYSFMIPVTDADNEELFFSISSAGSALADGQEHPVISATGEVTWVPQQTGEVEISISVGDGTGLFVLRSYTLTVVPA